MCEPVSIGAIIGGTLAGGAVSGASAVAIGATTGALAGLGVREVTQEYKHHRRKARDKRVKQMQSMMPKNDTDNLRTPTMSDNAVQKAGQDTRRAAAGLGTVKTSMKGLGTPATTKKNKLGQ